MTGTLRRLAAAGAVLALASGCAAVDGVLGAPPESAYTQAEAYAPMEEAVAEAVAVLPDFPGFEGRDWHELTCSHGGVGDDEYTNIEIEYAFSVPDSETPLVRETYVDALREHWTGLGYEITRDESTELEDRTDHSLSAEREDGIGLTFWVTGRTVLRVNSGCVPVSDPGEFEYIAPAGGIQPGGEQDDVGRYFPDGIPTAHGAAAPFESREVSLQA